MCWVLEDGNGVQVCLPTPTIWGRVSQAEGIGRERPIDWATKHAGEEV